MMSSKLTIWIIAALLCAESTAASHAAGLTWERTRVQPVLDLAEDHTTIAFPFKNSGKDPIRIDAVEVSCSCLVVDYPKGMIEAGSTGVLTIVLNVGGRIGTVDSSVKVKTGDGNSATLNVTARIPEVLTMQPRSLYWLKDEPASLKSARIVVGDPARVRIAGVKQSTADFNVALSPEGEGKGIYRLEVKPVKTARSSSTLLTVLATVDGRQVSFLVFASVR